MHALLLQPVLALAPAFAHGAVFPPPPVYGGPGDAGVFPPTAGPGRGAPAGPPQTQGPGVPGVPGPGAGGKPSSGGGPSTDARGGESASHWSNWWNLNRAPYLDLKRRIHARGPVTGSAGFFLGRGAGEVERRSLEPAREEVRTEVVPALLALLAEESSNDVLTACAIALAKIGEERAGLEPGALAARFLPLLAHPSQEVAETAALALGILRSPRSLEPLLALMDDEPLGRELVGGRGVPERTRAFAAFGLGVLGAASEDVDLRRRVAARLLEVLDLPAQATQDLKIAATCALGLVPLEVRPRAPRPGTWGRDPRSTAKVVSRTTQIAALVEWLDGRAGRGADRPWQVELHVPTALARLAAGAPERTRAFVAELLCGRLVARSQASPEMKQSCVQALGSLGDADEDEHDVLVRKTLERLVDEGEPLTRRLALVALAQVGARPGTGEAPLAAGEAIFRRLLRELSAGASGERPWAALALGVLGRGLQDAGLEPPPELAASLRLATEQCKRPQDIGAHALALGLVRDPRAGSLLLEKLDAFSVEEAKGDLAIALGLARVEEASAAIEELLRASRFRPELLSRAATGLALLGERSAVDLLVEMLAASNSTASQAACAAGLGLVGDARSIEPLLALLRDRQRTATARAFAVVALGIVCDPDPLPWNTALSVGSPWYPVPATMIGQGRGVLEIL